MLTELGLHRALVEPGRRRPRTLHLSVHGRTRSRRERSSPSWPASIGWFMVLRRQTFAGHTLSLIAFPGAAAAVLAGVPHRPRVLRRLRPRRARARRRVRPPPQPGNASRRRRDRSRRSRSGSAFSSSASTTACSTGSTRCSSARSSASRARRCSSCSSSPRSRSLSSPSPRGRCSSRRSTPTSPAPSGVPRAAARPRLPARARPLGRGDEPDHRRAARLRAARDAGRDGAAADDATARRRRAVGRARARSSRGSGSRSRTSPSTRSASTSRRSRSRSTSSRGCLPDARAGVHAQRARRGSFVGIACGLVGYFVVLRAQVFAGDALSHVAFTGALAAAALGIDIRAGLLRRDDPRRRRHGRARRPRARRRRRHRDALRLDARARRPLPHHLHDERQRLRTGPPACACSSGRSSD